MIDDTRDVERSTEINAQQVSLRAAKKEQTRSRLIEAAADLFAERGFHGASLVDVASRAGLTTGAVYSNFRSKEALFVAVIREVSVPFHPGPESSTVSERLRVAAIAAARDVELPASRRLLKLQLEFALLTLQDPALMRGAAEDLHEDREQVARLLTAGEPAPRPEFRPTSDELATAIIASLQGLQQHRFVDRDAVPEELAGWVVQALLHVALGESGGDASVL